MSNENSSAYLELRWGAPSPLAPTVIGDGHSSFGNPDRMFIVEADDLFNFDGTTVTYAIQDDPDIDSGNFSYCLKTFDGKLFWIAANAGVERRVFRSLDSGVTAIEGGASSGFMTHFDVAADGTLYGLSFLLTDIDLIRSSDDGATWTSLIAALPNSTQGAAVACHPTDATRIAFIELSQGISAFLRVSTDGGASFSSLALVAPYQSPFRFFGFQPRWLPSGRLVWTFTDDATASLYVQWSDDDGASVAGSFELLAGDPTFEFSDFDGMWMDADGVLYVAATDDAADVHIFRSPDGSTWTDLGALGANGSRVQGMAFMNDTMYVLNNAPEMWKIPTPGTTWVPELILDSGSGSPFGDGDTIAANEDALVAARGV